MNVLRWLREHEPVWLVTIAAGLVDVLTHVLPMVPAGWHPGVDIVLALLTVAAGRQLVISPATAARLGAPTRVARPGGAVLLVGEHGPEPATSRGVRVLSAEETQRVLGHLDRPVDEDPPPASPSPA